MSKSYLLKTSSFGHVVARATTNPRARRAFGKWFRDADLGKTSDGLADVLSCRLAPEFDDVPLLRPELGPEGVCISLIGWSNRARHGTQRDESTD